MFGSFFFADGDNDSGVDESTQKATKSQPQSPSKGAAGGGGGGGARSRGARNVGGGGGGGRRPPPRSQSVPKPFSTYGATPPSNEKKGE